MKKYQMYINGEFVEGENKEYSDVVNPSTDELVSQVPVGTINDVKKAIDVAQLAQISAQFYPLPYQRAMLAPAPYEFAHQYR